MKEFEEEDFEEDDEDDDDEEPEEDKDWQFLISFIFQLGLL